MAEYTRVPDVESDEQSTSSCDGGRGFAASRTQRVCLTVLSCSAVAAIATSAATPGWRSSALGQLAAAPLSNGTAVTMPAADGGDSDDNEAMVLPTLKTQYMFVNVGQGSQRSVLSWNKRMGSGPTVRVPLNRMISATLENDLYSDTVTLHHHGIHQIGTPYFDGTMGVTQAGVQPGRSMTYTFKAWPAGTHWYHSHSSSQLADGLKGMFIVEDPDDPWIRHYTVDDALMFYEFFGINGNDANVMNWEGLGSERNPADSFPGGLVNGIPSVRYPITAEV